MAQRPPLVVVSGVPTTLPTGDTLSVSSLAATGGVTTGGNISIGGSGRIVGSGGFRIEGTLDAGPQSGSTGKGIEFGLNTGVPLLQSVDRSAGALTTISLQGSQITLVGFLSTANAPNVFADSAGIIYRSTSSSKYKTDVEDVELNRAYDAVSVRPIWYRSIFDNPDHSFYGFLAEDVADVDPRLAHWGFQSDQYEDYDDNGVTKQRVKEGEKPRPDGVQYERFVVMQQAVIQDLKARIEQLEKRLKD